MRHGLLRFAQTLQYNSPSLSIYPLHGYISPKLFPWERESIDFAWWNKAKTVSLNKNKAN